MNLRTFSWLICTVEHLQKDSFGNASHILRVSNIQRIHYDRRTMCAKSFYHRKCTTQEFEINVQKGSISILAKDETGSLAAASVKAVVSDSKGKRLGEVPSLGGSQGKYTLDLLEHVSSAGLHK